ncbi:MAG: pentapeptide repeat-containing protein [Microcoleus sp.]
MTLVNRKQISLYEEAEAGLNSLVKQTAQVGVGLLGMLLLTGGNPPALTVGLSVVGGIAFVAWSEEKRLTKFYARQTQLIHNSVIASETNQSQLKHHPVIASETKQSQIPNTSESQSIQSILKHNSVIASEAKQSQIPNTSESQSIQSIQNDIKQILEADTNNLSELVKQAGLNPYEDLAGADLSSVKGIGCKLSRFNLSGADLDHADLSRADLSFANLSNAKLTNVKLCRADLRGADLRNALLMDANLSFADLSDADLSDADLINADLSTANLSNANLHNANLTSTNLNTAQVENARFGKNAGLDEEAKYELEKRGAIFPQDERIAAPV